MSPSNEERQRVFRELFFKMIHRFPGNRATRYRSRHKFRKCGTRQNGPERFFLFVSWLAFAFLMCLLARIVGWPFNVSRTTRLGPPRKPGHDPIKVSV